MDADTTIENTSNYTDNSLEEYNLPLKVYIWGVLMIMLAIVNVLYLIIEPNVHRFYVFFFYSIPTNTAISVFPHEPVFLLCKRGDNLLLVALLSTAGTLCAAYLDHAVFTPLLNHPKFSGYKNNTIYQKALQYFHKFPFWTIVLAGLTPVPFWPIKMLSFSYKYPLGKYLAAVAVGRFPRYYLLAVFGSITTLPNWVIWLIFLIFIIYGVYDWLKTRNNNTQK